MSVASTIRSHCTLRLLYNDITRPVTLPYFACSSICLLQVLLSLLQKISRANHSATRSSNTRENETVDSSNGNAAAELYSLYRSLNVQWERIGDARTCLRSLHSAKFALSRARCRESPVKQAPLMFGKVTRTKVCQSACTKYQRCSSCSFPLFLPSEE